MHVLLQVNFSNCQCVCTGFLKICPLSYRDIDEDVQSVKQFSSELIVEAVVRCLRVIDPSLGSGLSTTLPPGMSARFRLGMSLAQACQVRAGNTLGILCSDFQP